MDEQIVLVNVCCGAQMQNKIEMFVKQWLKVWLAGNKLENYTTMYMYLTLLPRLFMLYS